MLKGINEGMYLSSQSNQNAQPGQSCSKHNKDDPRVLILENESFSTKLKMLEQSFQSQMSIMRLETDKKISEIAAAQAEQMKRNEEIISSKLAEIKRKQYNQPHTKQLKTIAEVQTKMEERISKLEKLPYKDPPRVQPSCTTVLSVFLRSRFRI